MIPLLAVIGFHNQRNRAFRLWIPLFLVWLLLAPVVLLLLPIFFILCWIGKANPFQAISTFWQVLAGLKATCLEVVQPRTAIMIRTF